METTLSHVKAILLIGLSVAGATIFLVALIGAFWLSASYISHPIGVLLHNSSSIFERDISEQHDRALPTDTTTLAQRRERSQRLIGVIIAFLLFGATFLVEFLRSSDDHPKDKEGRMVGFNAWAAFLALVMAVFDAFVALAILSGVAKLLLRGR